MNDEDGEDGVYVEMMSSNDGDNEEGNDELYGDVADNSSAISMLRNFNLHVCSQKCIQQVCNRLHFNFNNFNFNFAAQL